MAAHTSTRKVPALLAVLATTIALACAPSAAVLVSDLLYRLTNTVIGLGGRGDPAAANIPAKLSGDVVPDGYDYLPSPYPASLNMIDSVRIGMPGLHQLVTTTPQKVIVVSYSEGSLLAEHEKRNLRTDVAAPAPENLSFVEIAAPFIPNGGIFARFPGVGIPFLIPGMGVAQPTVYDTTYVTNEYDPYADFPAYFNPLALANSLLAVAYAHPDAYYDPDHLDGADNFTKTVENAAHGHDTYVLVPNEHLPLLAPVRAVAAVLRVSRPVERLLGAVEPMLKVMVDMAYTDRTNLNPEVQQSFSMVTPPHKIAEALAATPRALRQGLDNLLGRTPKKPATASTNPAARGPTDLTDGNKVTPTTLAGAKPTAHPVKTPTVADTEPEKDDPPTTGAQDPPSAPTGETPSDTDTSAAAA